MFHFDRIQQKLLFILCGVILILSGILLYREYGRRDESPVVAEQPGWEQPDSTGEPTAVSERERPEETGESEKIIKIHISGQVRSPGVITLAEGDRMEDAIEQAGGALPDADLDRVNLAMKVRDEGRYHIPAVGEELPSGIPDNNTVPSEGGGEKININEADQSQLETLNGIGPAKARKIIEYREENGEFRTIEEIMNVSGIGEKTFEGMKSRIDVR